MEAGTGNLGGIQRHCPCMQIRSLECQSPTKIESGECKERQEKGIL